MRSIFIAILAVVWLPPAGAAQICTNWGEADQSVKRRAIEINLEKMGIGQSCGQQHLEHLIRFTNRLCDSDLTFNNETYAMMLQDEAEEVCSP